MADYIDREKIFSIWRSMPAPASVTSLAAAISQTPAADVAEVRHGRWIVTDVDWGYSDAAGKNFVSHKYTCSVCDYETGDQGEKFVCCPMCMSRMDKEDKDA